ncbi:hypothetical protein MCOR27_009821 [Pyricularia oryzae]|uniref:Fumarylacetoacetase-like C-terminal domain-containing protein n=1 Tax=Pyricularia grisea TaxID=148305 RepID=A0ABQ8N6H2_PYRGI|nr:hypothetical protein MCOR01_000532 [Pyricularia oryzae]KAI6291990.1 hypothetical protein MCOR33_010192 [Pyricularia grisea]KAH9428719.1 hypothetical protein MCOR02_011265 [Pyricularia oryzae]KAI6253264.1 hypothetical protein MCOR19_010177 [Pyricularia oryzae]KAI6265211.1 hypothetical protein MCOR26_010872 [Pyricularia oryzae]
MMRNTVPQRLAAGVRFLARNASSQPHTASRGGLIRFVSQADGKTYYGLADQHLREAETLSAGHPFGGDARPTGVRQPISQLLSPLARDDCRGIVCIGLNYRDHAEEAKMAIPTVPVVFYKPVTALAGPNDDLIIPRASWEKGALDYEAELVIVIGKEASRVSEAQALDYVYGYTVGNDFSNRTWQLDKTLSGGQWCFSKSFDASAPIGPAIVPKEALGDAANLSIRANLNGETMQDSNTSQMIFGAAKLVSFLSQAMTLLPGTLIFTGTPAGVGLGRSPQVVVKEGDVLDVAIGGIGKISNRVVYEK